MKILVAMSGGVDSSVVAQLLTEAGHTCIGCTMKLYQNEDAGISPQRTCCSLSDVQDARQVAYRLGMPYYVFNFTEDFREKIIRKFADSYFRALTPNPCIDCNRYMKFGKLFERAELLGCDHIATGHYARIAEEDGYYLLKKGRDPGKDQSYVLYAMTQWQLAHTLFPLGELHKAEVRQLAQAGGLVTADKKDSQDICFVKDGDYAAAVERHAGQCATPGDFLDTEGHVLGQHRGIIHYTVGQHRGLGIELSGKRYVTAIDPQQNTVTLGTADALMRATVTVEDVNWIRGEAPEAPVRAGVKIRYRAPEASATVIPLDRTHARIEFDQPQRAVTPGQAAVFYTGDTVLGGGTILP